MRIYASTILSVAECTVAVLRVAWNDCAPIR